MHAVAVADLRNIHGSSKDFLKFLSPGNVAKKNLINELLHLRSSSHERQDNAKGIAMQGLAAETKRLRIFDMCWRMIALVLHSDCFPYRNVPTSL